MTSNHDESSMPAKRNKQQRQMTFWDSDDCIVPLTPGNAGRGKAVRPTRDSSRPPATHRSGTPVHDRLNRITTRAESDTAATFSNLFSLLNTELLFYAFRKLKRDKAPGVDGVTVDDYEEDLQDNLQGLEDRLHRGSYRPQPSLRREISKGNGKTRPLGIACVEEKIVQRAIVMILERVYEVDFCDTSYGFRPGRSCHQALADLGQIITRRRVNWVLDADIKGFFDHVDFSKLQELLGRRIKDTRMLRLITKFLHAGVMIQDKRHDTTEGVAQGSVLSPLLANVYLHYVLDEWFEQQVKPRLSSEATIIRYADDFICTFERESDAKRFREVLGKRLGRYSLELAEEKTKLLRFGRFASRDCQRHGEGSPGTFDFLGFMHYCGSSRAGKFKLKRRTSVKKYGAKVRELKEWFRTQLTVPVRDVWPTLLRKLHGHFQYYNVNDNWPMLMKYREAARRLGLRWMRRRSQKARDLSWEAYRRFLEHHPLPLPGRVKDLIAMGRTP